MKAGGRLQYRLSELDRWLRDHEESFAFDDEGDDVGSISGGASQVRTRNPRQPDTRRAPPPSTALTGSDTRQKREGGPTEAGGCTYGDITCTERANGTWLARARYCDVDGVVREYRKSGETKNKARATLRAAPESVSAMRDGLRAVLRVLRASHGLSGWRC